MYLKAIHFSDVRYHLALFYSLLAYNHRPPRRNITAIGEDKKQNILGLKNIFVERKNVKTKFFLRTNIEKWKIFQFSILVFGKFSIFQNCTKQK